MKPGNTKGISIKRYAFNTLSLSVLALTLIGCATDAPPPPPPAPPPPPPAPAGPPVALAPEISDAAAIYVDYIGQARAIKADFADGASVQARLQSGETYEPAQLARGVVAYGAIVAMQEPSFRSALRAYAANDAARADMVQHLLSDPNYAGGLPSADIAARRVILALSSDGQSVYKAGTNVKQSAYDIQHQKWSKDFITDRDGRLALARQNSVTLKSVQSDQSAELLNAALTGSGLTTRATTGQSTGDTSIQATTGAPTGQSSMAADANASAIPAADVAPAVGAFDLPNLFNAPYTPTVNRALTIAALAILGEGGASRSEALVSLLNEGDGQKCLSMSKLMLYQCLAVAKPHYEDVFCLGQHVLMDTGQCIGKMSSYALSFDPVKRVGFKEDGSSAYSNDVHPYLAPPAPVKKKKGKATAKKKKK